MVGHFLQGSLRTEIGIRDQARGTMSRVIFTRMFFNRESALTIRHYRQYGMAPAYARGFN